MFMFRKYSRLRLIYPNLIETVKDWPWADCEQLTSIEVGQIFVKFNQLQLFTVSPVLDCFYYTWVYKQSLLYFA